MSLIDKLIGILAPHECLGCGEEGALLCVLCIQLFPELPQCCYRCRRLSPDSLTCTKCRKASRLYRVQPVTVYEGIAQDLIWKLKSAGAQAAAQHMASCMLPFIDSAQPAIIVAVPTATSRVRERGYDQAKLLARAIAKNSRLPAVNCLRRIGQAHQVGASRQARLHQLKQAFRVSQKHAINGAHIILVDDVVTTGATLEAAALVLKQAGAKKVEAIVFAQP